MLAGGAAVADAWMETVADIDDSILLKAVDEAQAAAAAAGREERAPVIRLLKPTQLFYKAKLQKVKQSLDVEKGDIAKSLTEAFELAAAFTPKDPAAQQIVELKNFIRLLSARKASKAEGVTLKNVIRTIAELHKFQLLRGRAEGLADVDIIDLSAFLEEGTSALARALPALKWLAKHAGLAWAVTELAAPEKSKRVEPGEQ